jgi:hypothetical protein
MNGIATKRKALVGKDLKEKYELSADSRRNSYECQAKKPSRQRGETSDTMASCLKPESPAWATLPHLAFDTVSIRLV